MPIGTGLYGTNEDTTANTNYCKYCFENGKFREPLITLEEMIERSAARIVDEQNLSHEEAADMANKLIPALERWRNN